MTNEKYASIRCANQEMCGLYKEWVRLDKEDPIVFGPDAVNNYSCLAAGANICTIPLSLNIQYLTLKEMQKLTGETQ